MERFYWLVENNIAGCSRPGGTARPHRWTWGRGQRDGENDALDNDLAWLTQHEIEAILSLTETPLEQEVVDRHQLQVLHLPVPDMHAPLPVQLDRALDFIDEQRAHGRSVAVHCLMGQGRTGTILAAYLIRGGMTAQQAIDELRAICPGAIESADQRAALSAYADRRDWMV